MTKLESRRDASTTSQQRLIPFLYSDFSSQGIRFLDVSSLSSSVKDEVINYDTVSTKVEALLQKDAKERTLYERMKKRVKRLTAGKKRMEHLGDEYMVKEDKAEGVSRKQYKLVDKRSVQPETFAINTELSLTAIVQGQDSTLKIRTYTNSKESVDVCIFTRAHNTHAYAGKIPWTKNYKEDIATVFGLTAPKMAK